MYIGTPTFKTTQKFKNKADGSVTGILHGFIQFKPLHHGLKLGVAFASGYVGVASLP